MPKSDEQRLTAVFDVNEQLAKVPDAPGAPDPLLMMKTAPPYKGTTTKPHTRTHTCHRQVNLLSDRSSTQSFTCATRLTRCKIHTE